MLGAKQRDALGANANVREVADWPGQAGVRDAIRSPH